MTESYRHIPRDIIYYLYDDTQSNGVIAERLDTGDKIMFSGWIEVENSEYWEKA